MADGSIRIETSIDTKGLQADLNRLEKSIEKSASEIESLRSKMNELGSAKIPTQEYIELQKYIDSTEKKLNTLVERQEKFLATGGRQSSATYQRMLIDIDQLRNTLDYAKSDMQDLVNSGKAFTLGADTEEYTKAAQRVEELTGKMSEDSARAAEIQSALAAEEQRLASIKENATITDQKIVEMLERRRILMQQIADMEKAGLSYGYQEYDSAKRELSVIEQQVKAYSNMQSIKYSAQGISNELGKVKSSAKGAFSALSSGSKKSDISMKKGLTTVLKYGFGIRSLYFLFNKIRNAIKEGFNNLVQYSEPLNQSFSALQSSMTQLKNSFATAFAPIVQTVIPYIQSLISTIVQALNYITQLSAVISGAGTWTKAVAVQEDYAASLKGTASAAKKAAGALASFDTLEVLSKKDTGGAAGISPKDMFEEVPVDPKLESNLDKIKETVKPILDYFDDLKDIFIQGFWDGLGDWEYRLESIKDSVISIKDSLVDIFTDPAVVSAANEYFKSVSYLIGSLLGSLASVGLTIATMVLGGISKYLEQNKQRIKDFLVSYFDIKAEINYLISDALQSIAYVFESFASENGQQLMANLIGIFVDAYMGIEEFLLKSARDILNIIIQPFVENKEALRSALEDFLGVLVDVTGTAKDAIDDTFDHLNDVYDAHLKPFFDSVASGLSELLGHLLNFWSGYVQPILEELADLIDSVWKSHVQPAINSIIDLLGGLADMLKALWENIMNPLLDWLIDNVLPMVAIVIGGVSEIVVGLVGIIADVISDITGNIRGIVEFLTNVFQGDWESAWDSIVNVIESPILGRFKDAGKNLIDGLVNGIKSAWDSATDTISSVATDIKDTFCSLLGIHSPSTVFEQFGVYLLQGLANGITSAIDLVGSAISGIVENILGMFDFNKWSEAGQGMIESILVVIEEFKEIWNTAFTEWVESNNELYFGYDVWYSQFENIMLAYTDVNGEFMSGWKANMNTWWTTMVTPFFTVAQWQLFGTNMKTGIMQGFKVIVNEIGGVLNNIIAMFDEAFEKLEESMNDLIDSYNSSAGVLGTSTLSRVHYNSMGKINIPKLADGAVIRGGNPFIAMLGDQRRGQTNIEAPISTIEEAVSNVMSRQNTGSAPSSLNLYIDSEKVAQVTLDSFLSEMNRRGYNLDPIGE